jgi:hypothetical protein
MPSEVRRHDPPNGGNRNSPRETVGWSAGWRASSSAVATTRSTRLGVSPNSSIDACNCQWERNLGSRPRNPFRLAVIDSEL